MDDRNDGKQTSPEAAGAASDVLRDGRTADDSKSAAGSALSQAGQQGREKETSPEASAAASRTLQDEDTGPNSRKAAGSDLSQAEGGNH
jgi:hypothetical protein